MTRHPISELLDRLLVVVAHPDDESIGSGALLQRTPDSLVMFCTDGGPRDEFFWRSYGSRENYVLVRHQEARVAGDVIGATRQVFLPIVDQELHRNLGSAYRELLRVIEAFRPEAILTLAYEGGHPDHDCCAFLSHVAAAERNLPVWEMPLYHRSRQGPKYQEFPGAQGEIHRLQINPQELARKQTMVSSYSSQANVLAGFDLRSELFRPQLQYDFLVPPPVEMINYEFWNWPVSAKSLCAAFETFIASSCEKALPSH